MNRNRFLYFVLIVITVLVGLASRHINFKPDSWLKLYLGDALWALLVFLLIGFTFTRKSSMWIAIVALVFSFCIEISQLYHALWIDYIRNTSLGGLILGFGFLWSDLLCYSAGIGFGYVIERKFLKQQGKKYLGS